MSKRISLKTKKSSKSSNKSQAHQEAHQNSKTSLSVQEFKLENGLSVLVLPDSKSPVVSVQMWVQTGSADEQKGEEGISHFIEHLVFKGTENFEVAEIASTVEAAGGELNAYTSFDETVFYVTISKKFTDTGLRVIAEMMGSPRFDSAEIDNEREVVIEEIKRSKDSPGRESSRVLFKEIYRKHPYGRPVLGYDQVIRNVKRETLVDYYRRRYTTSNMLLVVVGDVDPKKIQNQIKKNFSSFKKLRLHKVERVTEQPQKTSRLAVHKSAFQETYFHLAWPIPHAMHADIPALEVLALVLGQGDSSRLVRRLRLQQPLVNSISSNTMTLKDPGLFAISGSLNPANLTSVVEALHEELENIWQEAPTRAELDKAVTNFESDASYRLETVDGLARRIGYYKTLTGDVNYFDKFMQQVRDLKPDDLKLAARKYLRPEYLNLVALTPEAGALEDSYQFVQNKFEKFIGKFKQIVEHIEKSEAISSKIKNKSKANSRINNKNNYGIEKLTLSSGARLIFRPSFATPVISVKAAFLGGQRWEPSVSPQGLSELLGRTWVTGTASMSESEIQSRVEEMAAGFSAYAGRNSSGLSLDVLQPYERAASHLFTEVLVAPVISAAAVEREKKMMLEFLRSREDHPSQLVSQMFTETIFAGHPYARDMAGRVESVPQLNLDLVNEHWQRMAFPTNLTIVVTGAANRELWIDALEKATDQLAQRSGGSHELINKKFTAKVIDQDIHSFRSIDREQTHIVYGYRGLQFLDDRKYTLELIQSILAGQGGRLFIELRDKASLAYSVAPLHMEGIDAGYFAAYIGCSPEKGRQAIAMMQAEFEKLVQVPVDREELKRAQNYLIGRHDIDLQRVSAIGSGILFNEIYGRSGAEIFNYAEKLEKVTPQDIQNLAREIFTTSPVACAVGREQPW